MDEEDSSEWETRKCKELYYDMITSAMSPTKLFTTPLRAKDKGKANNTHWDAARDGTQEAWSYVPKVNRDTLSQLTRREA